MRFYKYHALGNDYIVMSLHALKDRLNEASIRRICHRHFGAGSDGILVDDGARSAGEFCLRIFNPDGSEAEKSGNGLRIFARYLLDQGFVKTEPFTVHTKGGRVQCQVFEQGAEVEVEMGSVSFKSSLIPVSGPEREVLHDSINILGTTFDFAAATVGNPHCVILRPKALREDAIRFGPEIEVHPLFPNRTNVQFLEVIDRQNIRIEIWERGAGYTLASGSSSSASAAVAHRLGLCDSHVTVHMPGGKIQISIEDGYSIRMKGAVTRVADGNLYDEVFSWKAAEEHN